MLESLIFSGLLIIANDAKHGDDANISSVELWAPGKDGVQCRLPDMTVPMTWYDYPTLNSILVGSDNNSHWFTITCVEGACWKFTKGNWELHRTYGNKSYPRDGHTSAVMYTNSSEGNIILSGGGDPSETNTTVIIPDDRDQETGVREGFSLNNSRWLHCSIQLDNDGFVLTGGDAVVGMWGDTRYSDKVTEYLYKKGGDGVNVRDLPPLTEGRYVHACGAYHARGSKVNHSAVFSSYILRCSSLLEVGGWVGDRGSGRTFWTAQR